MSPRSDLEALAAKMLHRANNFDGLPQNRNQLGEWAAQLTQIAAQLREHTRKALKVGFIAGCGAARAGPSANEAWENSHVRHEYDYPSAPPDRRTA